MIFVYALLLINTINDELRTWSFVLAADAAHKRLASGYENSTKKGTICKSCSNSVR